MSEAAIGCIFLLALLAFFMTGIELAFAMGIIGVAGFAYLVDVKAAMGLMANDFFDALASYGLTVIPLFILMGQIAFNAGIAKRLYDCAHKFLGHVPGGLAIATVAGATAFKAICGSVAATAATFASVAVPEMTKYGYSKKLSTGIVATVGTLGVLIPPSVVLIIFGIITQLSIGRLFLAGLIPGLLIAFFFVVVILGWCRINPELGPKSEKFPWSAPGEDASRDHLAHRDLLCDHYRPYEGDIHPHGSRQHRRLRSAPSVLLQEKHQLQRLRKVREGSPENGLYGIVVDCHVEHARSLYRSDEYPERPGWTGCWASKYRRCSS